MMAGFAFDKSFYANDKIYYSRTFGNQRRGIIKPPPVNIPQFEGVPALTNLRPEEAKVSETSLETQVRRNHKPR